MLSIGDVAQPGALGASYGMGPYTVIPGGAGPASPALPASGMPAGVSSLGDAAVSGSGASQGVPATSGLSPASAVPSDPAASVFGAQSPAAVPEAPSPGSIAAPSLDSPVQSALGSAAPSGDLPANGFPGAAPSLPSGAVPATPDLTSAGAQTSPPLSGNAFGSDLAAPSTSGSVDGGAAFAQPNGLPTASAVPQSPPGQDSDSYQAIMAILKGGSPT